MIIITNNEEKSEWNDFFPKHISADIDFIKKVPSILLLVKTTKGVLAIIGGVFYHYILPLIDKKFGLNFYSLIMKPAEDKIYNIKTRSVTGLRAGMTEQFKDNYRIIDYLKFGKIPTEIKIKLSEEISSQYFSEFLNNNSLNLIIQITSGFKVIKKLTFNKLDLLIDIMVYIEENETPNLYFSSYKEISGNIINDRLKPALTNKLFNARENILADKNFEFDIVYPNKIDEFYSADEYVIKILREGTKQSYDEIGRTSDKNQILKIILKSYEEKGYSKNIDEFTYRIRNTYIYFSIPGTIKEKRTGVIYYLNTEISENSKTYIQLDSRWYKLQENFIQEMNERCNYFISSYNLNNKVISKKWKVKLKDKKSDKKREKEECYNLKYKDLENYYVLDAINIDSIELADILYFDGEKTIYLAHVKYGFGSEMRELYNQIVASARRLKTT